MKNALLLLSISISILSYSLGIVLFGTYGYLNHTVYEQRLDLLNEQLIEKNNLHDSLLEEKRHLENTRYVKYLSQKYGYVSEHEELIFLPENSDSSIPIAGHGNDSDLLLLEGQTKSVSNSILLVISVIIGCMTYGISYIINYNIARRKDSKTENEK